VIPIPVILTLLGALAAGVVFLILAARRRTERLRELERAAQRLRAGESGAPAAESPDPIGRLGRAINALATDARARLDAAERERDDRERILAHLSDGVALIDGAGRVVRMNRSLAALFERPLPADPGTPFHEFARAPEVDDLVARARSERRGLESDLSLWSPAARRVRATATPLGAGAAEMVLLVLHDLTEREALQRVRQDFVANAAHELRTPLTSLRGYAETLLEGGLDDAEHRGEFVRVIRDQAVRLEALLEDLLSLAELERPDASLKAAPCDLREIVERQIAAYRPRAARAGLALELEPGPALPLVADAARLEQVVANLIDNAIKYTDRGSVRVRLGAENGVAWCEVEDTGPGIPAEDLPRIFERFYRVDKARSRERGGTGLGLSIVKHIATLHRGDVAVESVVGAGSRFRVSVPRLGLSERR
jgi:two-component system phosphate regulon sensor histidine kinase PhoR